VTWNTGGKKGKSQRKRTGMAPLWIHVSFVATFPASRRSESRSRWFTAVTGTELNWLVAASSRRHDYFCQAAPFDAFCASARISSMKLSNSFVLRRPTPQAAHHAASQAQRNDVHHGSWPWPSYTRSQTSLAHAHPDLFALHPPGIVRHVENRHCY